MHSQWHVWIRFGKWDEIIAAEVPADPELMLTCTATAWYAKALAHAAKGELDAAVTAREHFQGASAKVPETRVLKSVLTRASLAVAAKMCDGEIAYRQGDFDAAFAALREAVALEDGLPYDEPAGWMVPVRHALGALLTEQGGAHLAEAEAVYRADPERPPDNAWSLFGLAGCLRRAGADETSDVAPIAALGKTAAARADVPFGKASCFCALGLLAEGAEGGGP